MRRFPQPQVEIDAPLTPTALDRAFSQTLERHLEGYNLSGRRMRGFQKAKTRVALDGLASVRFWLVNGQPFRCSVGLDFISDTSPDWGGVEYAMTNSGAVFRREREPFHPTTIPPFERAQEIDHDCLKATLVGCHALRFIGDPRAEVDRLAALDGYERQSRVAAFTRSFAQ